MVDKILKMYEAEIKAFSIQMGQCRDCNDMKRYYELSMKFDELTMLFNRTFKIINEESAKWTFTESVIN